MKFLFIRLEQMLDHGFYLQSHHPIKMAVLSFVAVFSAIQIAILLSGVGIVYSFTVSLILTNGVFLTTYFFDLYEKDQRYEEDSILVEAGEGVWGSDIEWGESWALVYEHHADGSIFSAI